MRVGFSDERMNAKAFGQSLRFIEVRSIVALDPTGPLRDVATLKYFVPVRQGNTPRLSANFHLHTGLLSTNGSAEVHGNGDHLKSKAIGQLCESAGIGVWKEDGTEYDRFDWGKGDNQIEAFLRSVAIAAGFTNFIIVRNGG